MKKVLLWVCCITLTACEVNSPPPKSAALSSSVTEPKLSNWKVTKPQVSKLDGSTTQFIDTTGYVYIHLCYESPKPCSVLVSVAAPNGCIIESNLNGDYTSWKRRIRYKFDHGKPQTEVWSIDDSRDAIIPPNEKVFIAELNKHKTMVVEFGCASYDSEEVTIDIDGLTGAVANLDSAFHLHKGK